MNAQVMEALGMAEKARLSRAARRKTIKALGMDAGRAEVAATLRDPDPEDARIKARYLIESIDRMGEAKMGKLIRKTGIGLGRLSVPIGELTERERNLLADHLTHPDLPAAPAPVHFTDDELKLLRLVCVQVAHKTRFGKQRNQLWAIAQKAGAEVG